MSIQPISDGVKKRIEQCHVMARDIKTGFGNPRKIDKKEKEKLKKSLEMFGDFGIFVIDQENNVIAGNQRLSVIKQIDDSMMLSCKRLIGYSEAQLKAINIKANTHSGTWDLQMLATWTADLNIDLGIDPKEIAPQKRKIKQMQLIRYQKYDYVMIVCRNQVDYVNLQRILGIDNAKVLIVKQRKIKARAIWYDDIKAQIIPKQPVELLKTDEEITEITDQQYFKEEEQ